MNKFPVEKVIEDEWNNKNFSIRAMIYSILNIDAPKFKHNTEEYIPFLQSEVDRWKLKPILESKTNKPELNWWEKILKK